MFLKKNGDSEKSEAYLPQSPPRKKRKKKKNKNTQQLHSLNLFRASSLLPIIGLNSGL